MSKILSEIGAPLLALPPMIHRRFSHLAILPFAPSRPRIRHVRLIIRRRGLGRSGSGIPRRPQLDVLAASVPLFALWDARLPSLGFPFGSFLEPRRLPDRKHRHALSLTPNV